MTGARLPARKSSAFRLRMPSKTVTKEIIIPDLHQRHGWVDAYLSKRKHDRAIFLGDYFDDFDDTVDEAVATAKWLKSHLDDPDKVLLYGNHDIHYMLSLIHI